MAQFLLLQVLPQLLNHLDVTNVDKSIDWGTLLVYTCSESCEQPEHEQYSDEFVWKQDFSNVDNATWIDGFVSDKIKICI